MPELLTKHPEVALKILREAGVKCGEGVKQQILTTCPKDAFCRLPTGELCIYGVKDFPNMTQLTKADFASYQIPSVGIDIIFVSSVILAFSLGVVLGIFLIKK